MRSGVVAIVGEQLSLGIAQEMSAYTSRKLWDLESVTIDLLPQGCQIFLKASSVLITQDISVKFHLIGSQLVSSDQESTLLPSYFITQDMKSAVLGMWPQCFVEMEGRAHKVTGIPLCCQAKR